MTKRYFRTLILIILFFSAAAGESNDCVYTFYVKTDSGLKAGTDSKLSMAIGDATGRSVRVPNLESWGLMGPIHDYYERGNLDIFSGRGPCIGSPVCRLNLTSDGSGFQHGWYCDYVEVTSTGPHKGCSQSIFYVDQWLAYDAPPFQLTAMIDGCNFVNTPTKHHETTPFIVGNYAKFGTV